MKKTIIILMLSIIMLSIFVGFITQIQKKNNKIKEQNELIHFAQKIYNNEITLEQLDYSFEGKTIKRKYEYIENVLVKANELSIENKELTFSLGSIYFRQKKWDEALNVYNSLIIKYPHDIDSRIMIAAISKITGDLDTYNKQLLALKEENYNEVNIFTDIFSIVDNILVTPITTSNFQAGDPNQHAFIVLGYALTDDGNMQEPMYNRLTVLENEFKKQPNSTIIATGGVTKNGLTEAKVMYTWLVQQNIDGDGIILEDKSTNTKENAINTINLVKGENISNITLITSASHMRRALAIFHMVILLNELNDKSFHLNSVNHIAHMDFQNREDLNIITEEELFEIYRDIIMLSPLELYPIFN